MKKMIDWLEKTGQYLYQHPLDSVIILFFLVAIGKISSLYLSVDGDDGNWDQFKAEHHCIERLTDGISANASWLCDDGEIHYRWRQQR